MDNWQEKAKALFFCEHLKIGVIAGMVGKTRQTVSTYLRSMPEWNNEKLRRCEESKHRRKIGQLKWDRSNRAAEGAIRREHEQAVRELSAERYH